MLSGIGAILIVVGFILGVYCGVALSLKKMVTTDSGEIKQGKVAAITILCVVSVIMVFVGQLMFFNLK